MEKLVEAYLEDQKEAWSPTTLKSERSRLKKIAKYLKASPGEMYKELLLAGKKPYSIKTSFVRMCNFESWAVKKGHAKQEIFREYMERHKNKFKYSYQREEVGMTFEEARKRIMTLEEPCRSMALGMLQTGVRISEAYKIKDSKVVGKGGKPRRIYGNIKATIPKSTFWRKLKAAGLRPHALRKLWATKLVEKGVTPQDLCKAAGWSSLNTAYVYLQPKDEEILGNFIEDATKE